MTHPSHALVAFVLDGQRYGLRLSAVDRILPVAEVTHLAKAPDIVLGIINIQGQVIPVLNIRKRFHLPDRETRLSDNLILAHTARRLVALQVDEALGVMECSPGEVVRTDQIISGVKYLDGVVKLEDGMVLIHDLDGFLSLQEEEELGEALTEQ